MSFRRFPFLATLLAFTLLPGLLPAASNGPKIDPADRANIMLVKDVKPGMKGYGKTVFRGTKIDTFGVEVLGVEEDVRVGAREPRGAGRARGAPAAKGSGCV
jgi:hypothetical protein